MHAIATVNILFFFLYFKTFFQFLVQISVSINHTLMNSNSYTYWSW